jgi:hypothetical protein
MCRWLLNIIFIIFLFTHSLQQNFAILPRKLPINFNIILNYSVCRFSYFAVNVCNKQRWMVGRLVNNELERTWEEAVVAQSRYHPGIKQSLNTPIQWKLFAQ